MLKACNFSKAHTYQWKFPAEFKVNPARTCSACFASSLSTATKNFLLKSTGQQKNIRNICRQLLRSLSSSSFLTQRQSSRASLSAHSCQQTYPSSSKEYLRLCHPLLRSILAGQVIVLNLPRNDNYGRRMNLLWHCDVVLRHTLPVFTGLERRPIVSWDFAETVSIFWTGCPSMTFTRIRTRDLSSESRSS